MMKKKILIVGPIGDFGGRDVEVNIIARALETAYDTTILSTIPMTAASFSLQELTNTKWKSVPESLFKNNRLIRFLSRISKKRNKGNKGNKEVYDYVSNSLSKKLMNLDALSWEIIRNELAQTHLVVLPVQLTTKFLPEIVNYCHEAKIPCLLRTTGTIREVSSKDFDFLKKVTLFLHHSEANAANLNRQLALPYTIIDQCALTETGLLALDTVKKKPLRFGYLGRLSEEKGILPVARFFAQTEYPFFMAGDGSQKEALLQIIKNKTNCIYAGLLSNAAITDFFRQIDVLVIPSFEESGPLVGLEAMAAGKIIISTKVGAMPERLEGIKSFWFEIENVSSLQTVLAEIENSTDSELSNYAEEVRKKYIEKYSFDAVALQYKETVQQFLP
ncbi:glycosyltransferase family 4 protein [Flavobacterium saliperosum]|nr:glycosyltransferase family 4 protein [Flavobacterium saliperosum]